MCSQVLGICTMLNSRQFVLWLVLCYIITGCASSGDNSADSPSPKSAPENGNGESETDQKPQYDPGTSSLELEGRLALVTGGASGIGRSVAMVLARENVTVIVADKNMTGGNETIQYLKQLSGHLSHRAIYVDVRNSTLVEYLFLCIEMEYSNMNISIVVNSAGILHPITPVVNITDHTFDDVISTNLKGTFLITKRAVRHMLKQNVTGAAIVNIGSILGKGGFPGLSAYTASKGGVVAFTKAIAVELATKGIRVNAIQPGLTNTPMIQKYSEGDILERLQNMIPMKRIADPLEISETIVFMCSPKTSYMTGSVVDVAGGSML